ncbi:S8 family peptidase [Methylobacter psychrophilus]|uniref:S8 family peptidase n=1 Tax=Methylobacter psychrophilus TaxID=96941 RepID=UPI0021D4C3B5|nr:S8 family serine peptidase [Methylobacter psychrophilus]
MTLLRSILLLGLLVLLTACANTTDFPRLGDSATVDRRLLVTFVDRTINRQLPGNAIDGYRIRGHYNNSSWSERIANELADRHHLQLIAQWPVTALGVSCVVYNVPTQLQLQQVMADLQKDHQVSLVQQMHNFQVMGNKQSSSKPYSDPYLHLQSGIQSLLITDLHRITTGRGVRIALIDTGVDLNHPDLQGQINYTENLAPEPIDHNMAEVHGTAVAGILSARPDNGIGIVGIAPDAQVFALRACWPNKPGSLAAHCNSFTLALALNQAIKLDSRIINLSLSGAEDPLLRQLIEKALEKGIIVIAAVSGKHQAGGFPANISGVIAVGQGGEANNPDNLQIVAPGLDILTTVPHQAYDFMTGSSFATPHIVGVTALLLQLHPDWQANDIKQWLISDSNLLTARVLNAVTVIAKEH